MSEIKRNFTGVFIPANIWLSVELIPSEKMLLGEIDALSKESGWCYASRKHFAEWLQCGLPNITYYINKLERLGFLEVGRKQGERSKMRVVTARFYEKPKTDGVVSPTDGVVSPTDGVVSPTDGVVSPTDPKYKIINKNKNKSKEKEAPQAAVTTFTPDQISETAVTVVAHEVFTLEAGFQENTPIPAGPLKENPASQDAGAFEANPVPPVFQEEQQQSTYDLYQRLEAKPNPRKHSARPGPESEITDPAILEFYQAIAADWAEWVDYKRREKKGTYKTAQTEAVAIGGLYRKVSGSPDKAREAIQHSIENTYAGIFPPKPDYSKPTARRYSPEDRPANPVTGNDLLAEISQFYHANAGLWRQSLKEGNAEKWVQEKQVGAVKAFCLHQVSTGRATDTFAQLNAWLQQWFSKENSIQAASITGSPSTVHQAPARVSAPVRYQETE